MMDMTIEDYLEFEQHLLEQAEEDGFEIDSVDGLWNTELSLL
jgi:hypothetical protein